MAFAIMMILVPAPVSAQGKGSDRQASLNAFSRGDYNEAYSGFSRLLEEFPKDPLYKYYAGASLVELGREPSKAVTLLGESLRSSSMKSVPDLALFYLGRAHQMKGDYNDAERAFNRFTEEAGKKKAKDLKVPDFLEQCRNRQGRVAEQPVAVKPEPVKPVVQQEKPVVISRDTLPADVDIKMAEKLAASLKADSMKNVVPPAPAVRTDAGVKKDTVLVTKAKPDSTIAELVQVKPEVRVDKPAPVIADTTRKKIVENPPVIPAAKEPARNDSLLKIREILNKPTGVFSVFAVSPDGSAGPAEKIVINPDSPDGLIYRIQIAVFRNPVSLSYFKGISPIYGIKRTGTDVTVYYAGMFRKSADATKALTAVRGKGFKDAFVAPLLEGKPVSSDRASVLEKEWGTRPLFNAVSESSTQQADTIPPALVFRVEVARSIQPLNDETVEKMRKFAGTKGLDVKTLEDGKSAYLIGNFITFESAEEYAGLLTRNGFRESRVVAWLGRREINVDTARQLFENLR